MYNIIKNWQEKTTHWSIKDLIYVIQKQYQKNKTLSTSVSKKVQKTLYTEKQIVNELI